MAVVDFYPPGTGKSSFGLIDPHLLFAELGLKKGQVFFDMGCGRGEYSLAAARAVGEEGLVYGVDLWEEGIVSLRQEAGVRGWRNIRALIGDISRITPLEDHSVDMAFMATVLHDLVLGGTEKGALGEARRVLKSPGLLAVLEFKKIEPPPGPPLASRLSPEEVEEILRPFGFQKRKLAEVGPFNYLLIFSS